MQPNQHMRITCIIYNTYLFLTKNFTQNTNILSPETPSHVWSKEFATWQARADVVTSLLQGTILFCVRRQLMSTLLEITKLDKSRWK